MLLCTDINTSKLLYQNSCIEIVNTVCSTRLRKIFWVLHIIWFAGLLGSSQYASGTYCDRPYRYKFSWRWLYSAILRRVVMAENNQRFICTTVSIIRTPLRWKQQVHLKRWPISARKHGATAQKIIIFRSQSWELKNLKVSLLVLSLWNSLHVPVHYCMLLMQQSRFQFI